MSITPNNTSTKTSSLFFYIDFFLYVAWGIQTLHHQVSTELTPPPYRELLQEIIQVSMATATSVASATLIHHFRRKGVISFPSTIPPLPLWLPKAQKIKSFRICMAMADHKCSTDQKDEVVLQTSSPDYPKEAVNRIPPRAAERYARKESERFTYLVAAIMSTFGIGSMAVMAVYYRFSWQLEGEEIPVLEMLCTFALSVGAAVGMEFWARWAHRALWHASLWHMHESHHQPRDGPYEMNDVFAIINAVPAISLLAYGFFNGGLVPGLCFGAGLGITVFGMAYMFVHDGLVHRRFPVGPISKVPYLRRVASAHQIHHSDKFDGVPYGLFLGPKELEDVGGKEELDKEIKRRIKMSDAQSRT